MPHLEKLSLKEISVRFKKSDEFWFYCYDGGMLSFVCETSDLTYRLTFFPSPFAKLLEMPIHIDDLVAAIDEQRHFDLEIIF